MRQPVGILGTVSLGLLLLGSPALAGGVAIVGTELSDNGDDDGFADTYETVLLHLTIENTSGLDLRELTLRLSTDAAEITCISRPLLYVGDMAEGEVRQLEDAFVFTVGDVDRSALGLDERDDLSVQFGVYASADRLSASTLPRPSRWISIWTSPEARARRNSTRVSNPARSARLPTRISTRVATTSPDRTGTVVNTTTPTGRSLCPTASSRTASSEQLLNRQTTYSGRSTAPNCPVAASTAVTRSTSESRTRSRETTRRQWRLSKRCG